jgi:hypothetical protein
MDAQSPDSTRARSLAGLPATLKAGYRLARSRSQPGWPGFGQPFNGQAGRQETIRQLIAGFEPESYIETGTFFGFTTRRLAETGAPVFSVELDPGIHNVARMRLARHSNVTLLLGDSAKVLGDLTRDPSIRKPFVYLDAHWGDHLPLPEEVSVTFAAWDDALIAIDDFLVPDEPDYGYDVYNGQPLSLDLLDLPEGAMAAYPALPAKYETGARRGTLYLARGTSSTTVVKELIGVGTLKPPPDS